MMGPIFRARRNILVRIACRPHASVRAASENSPQRPAEKARRISPLGLKREGNVYGCLIFYGCRLLGVGGCVHRSAHYPAGRRASKRTVGCWPGLWGIALFISALVLGDPSTALYFPSFPRLSRPQPAHCLPPVWPQACCERDGVMSGLRFLCRKDASLATSVAWHRPWRRIEPSCWPAPPA